MVYVLFANGFEEVEGITAVDLLRRAELDVKAVGIGGKTVTGAHGIRLECDLEDSALSVDSLEMVVLPGGMPGTLNLEKSPKVQKLIDYAAEHQIWLAAICAAPSILGHKGLLEGKRATCFPGMESQLGGAEHTGQPVERDGKIITGRGPGSARQFALALVACLKGAQAAQKLEAAFV